MEQEEIEKILELIRERRKEKKISQQTLADYLGITQNSYKNIELGKTELKAKTLFQILQFLEIDLFSQTSPPSQETALVALDTQTVTQVLTNLVRDNQDLRTDLAELKIQNQELKSMLQELLNKIEK